MHTDVGGTAATRREPGRMAEARAPGSWSVADPGPLGLAAFALTTFVLSMFNSGRRHRVHVLGAFWISFFVFVTFFADTIPAADTGHAVGLYLIAWGIFTAYMFVASLRTTTAIATVFLLLTATFVLGIGDAGGTDGITKVGGWIGIATAAAAWYASFAVVTNSTFGRTVLPVRPLSR
jgi:succinate-acetate transporter protein